MIEGMSALTGHQDPQVQQAQKEIREILDRLERPDLLVLRERQGQREIEATLDQLELRELLGIRDLLDRLDPLAVSVLRGVRVTLDRQDPRGTQVTLDRKGFEEL